MDGTVEICPKCCTLIEACFSLTFSDEENKQSFLEQDSFIIVYEVTQAGSTIPLLVQDAVPTSFFVPLIDGLTLEFCREIPFASVPADGVYSTYVYINGITGDVARMFYEGNANDFYVDCAAKAKANTLFNDGLVPPGNASCCEGQNTRKKAMEAFLALEAIEASFCCGNYEAVRLNIEYINQL